MIVRWSRAAARQLFEAGDRLKGARSGLERASGGSVLHSPAQKHVLSSPPPSSDD